ncbi:uncharacterized protein ACIB01_002347 [Guaruba guarouba]
MDDDDEDEDEDGDGDPDAPPAPAAPLLLTSASSTSASHCWPQPPPTSTVRHIDTGPARRPPPPPRPHTAPARPARRPSHGANTHPLPTLTSRAGCRGGLRGKRGVGTEWDETGRGAPGNPTHPPRRGRLPACSTTLSPPLFVFYFPQGSVEKKNKSPICMWGNSGRFTAGCSRPVPAPRLSSPGRRLWGQCTVAGPTALGPPEPRGAGARLAAA